jgi:hypothetical protein
MQADAAFPSAPRSATRRASKVRSAIRDNPVRQAKTGFSIDLKCDQHVKKVSNM